MKFYGVIGYAVTKETSPGVWTESITERNYTGDVLRNTKRYVNTEQLNDNISLSNTFSVVADAFAYQNFFAIRYVKWMGAAWKVDTVEIQRPRLLLTIGGVYNGELSEESTAGTE
ncbi:MAG: hypothetical protein [Chaetfec virus UA24_144]|nr:MAG: hypothetical protein [Chaetfec virus UA24_144]